MLKNDDRTLRMTQSLKIKWRIWLLVCRFGNLVAPVLVAAHSVNNLGLRDEPEDEKKETEKLWREICLKTIIKMHSLLNVLLNFAYCDKKLQRIRVLKYYEDYYVDDDRVIEWHAGESHQKPKAQKTSIKKDLMPTAWHPSRWRDWCMTGDEKKEIMVINMKLFCT